MLINMAYEIILSHIINKTKKTISHNFRGLKFILDYYFWMQQMLLHIIAPRLHLPAVNRCLIQMMIQTKPQKMTRRLRVRDTVCKQWSGNVMK